ncbi:MAG TPA: hypothetical protein VGX68_16945 [Thermoanaerobaculia bacterium]|jgi:hypothetical protein|nr:hypothetical protein [Thermoanaerobaculia bacterium]
MKLIRIAKGRWDVLAVVDPRDRCQVLDLLDGTSAGSCTARNFLSVLLQIYLPLEGPPTCNHQICKPLDGEIFELRGPRGLEPRVLFFDGDSHRIVCTSFAKVEVPRSEILASRELRAQYFETKSRSELLVIEEARRRD